MAQLQSTYITGSLTTSANAVITGSLQVNKSGSGHTLLVGDNESLFQNTRYVEYGEQSSDFALLTKDSAKVFPLYVKNYRTDGYNPYGMLSTTEVSSSATTNFVISVAGNAYQRGPGHINNIFGVTSYLENISGSTTNMVGSQHGGNGVFTGTVTNAIGEWITDDYIAGPGTITNNYGIKVDDRTVGTNNWNIYSGVPTSSFNGVLAEYGYGDAKNTFTSLHTGGVFHGTLSSIKQVNVAHGYNGASSLQGAIQTSHTTGNVQQAWGTTGQFYASGSGTVSNAGAFQAYIETRNGSGNIVKLSGIELYSAVGAYDNTSTAGNVTNFYGIDSYADVYGNSNVTNIAHFRAHSSYHDGAGTISNVYGLLVDDQTAGTNNWAIKTGLGKVQFGDSVGINIGQPSASLHVSGTMMIQQVIEKVNVTASAPPATYNVDLTSGSLFFCSASTSANWTMNFRGDLTTTLNSMMYNGQSITATVLVFNGATPYSASAFQIDGVSVTPRWQGGTSGSANANSLDAHQFTIIKIASASYYVLGSITQYT